MYDNFKKILFNLFCLVLVQVTIYFIERHDSPIIVMSTIISQGVIIFADLVEPNEYLCIHCWQACMWGWAHCQRYSHKKKSRSARF